ncbi:MAG: hypothetical protein ACYCTG_13365, partial [Ferrimicrobium sp.]
TFDGSTGPTSITLPPLPPTGGYSYAISVEGTGRIADPLVVSDQLPFYAGLTYGSATIVTSSDFQGSCHTVTESNSHQSVSCTITPLSANTPVTFTGQASVGTITIPVFLASSIPAGSFANTATLSYDGTQVASSNTVTTTLTAAPTPTTSSSHTTPPSTTRVVVHPVTSPTPVHKAPITASKTVASQVPLPVKLVTGPPAAPTTSTPALDYGLALMGLGSTAFGLQTILRKRRGHLRSQ